ncbi:hypothetical protein LCGC14_0739960 [marine sediment metagenome]|uniref:Uncharacterized protein n=1 Tax=marine sediment metagenome TaxID=412755 RepID=A0A0F9Q739_9ZZZZ
MITAVEIANEAIKRGKQLEFEGKGKAGRADFISHVIDIYLEHPDWDEIPTTVIVGAIMRILDTDL